MAIKKVGIVGYGQMGSGIAEVCARSGYPTVLCGRDEERLNRGLQRMKNSMSRAVEAGKMTEAGMLEALARVSGTTSYGQLADCDLVIEAIVENMEVKKRLFASLEEICKPEVIFATNTSTLNVTEMAASTKQPNRFVGLHFFNPAPVMKLVEVIVTLLVKGEVVNESRSFAESLGKTPVVVKDSPGFVVNRLLVPYLLEAVRLMESGVASVEDIDQAMVLGTGHPMGPFALIDLIGIDVAYYSALSIYEESKDPKFAPPPLVKRMLLAGQLGRKTGKGFYEYKK